MGLCMKELVNSASRFVSVMEGMDGWVKKQVSNEWEITKYQVFSSSSDIFFLWILIKKLSKIMISK